MEETHPHLVKQKGNAARLNMPLDLTALLVSIAVPRGENKFLVVVLKHL